MDAPAQLNPDAVLAFIEGWLVGHITHSDAAYVPYILRDSEASVTETAFRHRTHGLNGAQEVMRAMERLQRKERSTTTRYLERLSLWT